MLLILPLRVVLAIAARFKLTASMTVVPSTKDFPLPVNPLVLLVKLALTNRVVPAVVRMLQIWPLSVTTEDVFVVVPDALCQIPWAVVFDKAAVLEVAVALPALVVVLELPPLTSEVVLLPLPPPQAVNAVSKVSPPKIMAVFFCFHNNIREVNVDQNHKCVPAAKSGA